MKIAIDALPAMLQKTGVGHYTHHLCSLLPKIAPEHDYYLCDALSGMGFYNMARLAKGSRVADRFFAISGVSFPFVTVARLRLLLSNKMRGETTRIEEADVFFGTNFRGLFSSSFKTVITIHDMAQMYFRETIEEKTLVYLENELPQAAQKAHRIIAVSETTKNDIVRFLDIPPERVKVVHNGVDAAFCPVADPAQLDQVRTRYRLPERFLLCVGTIQPRKNLARLLEAYAKICQEHGCQHDLVLVGGDGWKSEGLRQQIQSLQLSKRVHFTGYVTDADLPLLYNLADIFVFPSLYEGFGLPVLEAMACGIPVVTSNSSSLPEIAGDAALLVDPCDVESIAAGIRTLLADQELRTDFSRKGIARAKLFTWERCAHETLAVLREALEVP